MNRLGMKWNSSRFKPKSRSKEIAAIKDKYRKEDIALWKEPLSFRSTEKNLKVKETSTSRKDKYDANKIRIQGEIDLYKQYGVRMPRCPTQTPSTMSFLPNVLRISDTTTPSRS